MKSVLLYQSMTPCYIIGSLFDFDKLQPQRNTLLQILGTSQTVFTIYTIVPGQLIKYIGVYREDNNAKCLLFL